MIGVFLTHKMMTLTVFCADLLICVAGGMRLAHRWLTLWFWLHHWVGVAAQNSAARCSAADWLCICHAVCILRSQTCWL